jgi:tetratricopeptide (TPR) repeat protein
MTPGGAAIEELAHASNTEVEGIVDAVESGVQAGLLREREELGMAFIDFVHPIFRQTIEGMTGAARRTRLHLRLADAMEDFGASTEDGRLGELASHAFASGRAARPDRVVRLCKLAGEMATAHTAFESALVHYKRALEAMSWGKPEPAERGEIALRCAEAHHMLGDASARQEAAETAFADASRAHKAGLMARSALLHGGARSTYGVASERTMELLQQSLEALESQPDDSLRAQVMSRLAQEHYHVGNYPLSDELSGEAITLACGTGDDRVVAATMEGRIWSLHRPETLAQRSELCDEMVKRAAAADDRERLIVALIWRCCAGLEGGEIERIDVDLEWLDALTETVRIPSQMFRVMTMRTTRAVMAGDYERGMALALETYRIGESIEPDNARQTLAAQLLPMLREQDALASVVPEAQRMASTYSSAAGWRCALALVYLEADMPDRARAELNRLVQEGLDKIPRDLAWLLANCYLAEVAAWLGEPAQTQELYNRLLPYGDRNGAVFDIASVGSVSHHLALLAKAAGWTRKAAKHFEAAIEFNDRTGQMPAAARSRYEYSRLLLEVSGSAAAEAHLTQTLETARRLKLNRLVAGAERLVGEAQIDPAGVR